MRLSLVFLVFVTLASCKKDIGDCFKGTGDTTTETRNLPYFDKIEVNDNVSVYITQDSIPEVRIEAGSKLIGKIKTEVSQGVLKISNQNDCNWVRSLKNQFTVYINLTELTELTCYGTGNIFSTNTISADTLLIDLWESYSNISLQVEADYVHAKNHTGPGDVQLIGNTNFFYAYSTGNGFVYCDGLIANEAWAIHSGTGEMYVNAQDTLNAEINYIGNVHYAGNPSTINLNGNGEGELIALD